MASIWIIAAILFVVVCCENAYELESNAALCERMNREVSEKHNQAIEEWKKEGGLEPPPPPPPINWECR